VPQIGDIKKASELGYVGRGFYHYDACPDCGIPRWRRNINIGQRCPKCAAMLERGNRKASSRLSKRMHELGYKGKRNSLLYQDFCPQCGDELWRKPRTFGTLCSNCVKEVHRERMAGQRGVLNYRYTGGRYKCKRTGYVMVTLQRDDPYFCMTDKRNHRVAEHRLVYAQAISRPLQSWEIVHHINGIRDDNRFENLELHPKQASHLPSIRIQQELSRLGKRIAKLEAEVAEIKNEHLMEEVREIVDEYTKWEGDDGEI